MPCRNKKEDQEVEQIIPDLFFVSLCPFLSVFIFFTTVRKIEKFRTARILLTHSCQLHTSLALQTARTPQMAKHLR